MKVRIDNDYGNKKDNIISYNSKAIILFMKAKENIRKSNGRLKIGDNWNAITIIALSQSNPLKELLERMIELSLYAEENL